MANTNQLRIISGQFGGRRVRFVDAKGLRPTSDRLRETLFNWLASEIPGARCLDLFAGSGALGLEAVSRGAEHVTLVEKNPRVADGIRQTLSEFGVSNAKVVGSDALSFMKQQTSPYHIIFVDPPFDLALWEPVMESIVQYGLVQPGSWVYLEMDKRAPVIRLPVGFDQHRTKEAGEVRAHLYQWMGS